LKIKLHMSDERILYKNKDKLIFATYKGLHIDSLRKRGAGNVWNMNLESI
jgi:hypothetical protein